MVPLRPLPGLFLGSLSLALSGSLAAQGTPARFERFSDPAQLSPSANVIGFRGLPEGTRLGEPMGVYGLSLRLGDGPRPTVWLDREPRCFPPLSAAALSNDTPRTDKLGRAGVSLRDQECALVATFQVPVNRVGFELRGVGPGELNVVLRAFVGGREIGQEFFDADETFRFLGVQSSQPFDELRIELTNPSDALFSLDNLGHDLDLRDQDRDGWPDFIDSCPELANADQLDSDGDGIGDVCDPFPLDDENDADGDGIGKEADNCPSTFNPQQRDADRDGVGNVCDEFPYGPDADGDGIGDSADNCPTTFNPEQADCDLDGIGDVCDASLIHPSSVTFSLQPGECITVEKNVCVPPSPPSVDVLILFDTTGSMGGEIRRLQARVTDFVNGVRAALPHSDVRFGLASFRDYPGLYEACGYQAQYALATDAPFTVNAPIGSSNQEVLEAVQALTARGGQDLFESYGRALWEVSQPDSGLGFRPHAARFVLLVGDSAPHDCNPGALLGGCVPRFSSGRDPGRDGLLFTDDDIDFQEDALAGLVATHTRVLMMYTGQAAPCTWESWCAATGGGLVRGLPDGNLLPGTNLVTTLVNLIRDPVVDRVTYAARSDCGLALQFDPPLVTGPIDVSQGAQVAFQETICVPPGLSGPIDCQVEIFAEDVLLGVQDIHIEAGCRTHRLDFETAEDGLTPLLNGQALSGTPEFGGLVALSSAGPNLGLATFDSTPGGPNDPSINSDMLIGHGNLLILQDSAHPQQSGGVFLQPTDDPQGGDMVFTFPQPVDPRSILLADINPPPNLGASLTLTDSAGRTRVYSIEPGWTGPYGDAGPRQLDLSVTSPQLGYGTRRATALETPGFQQDAVVRLVVHMTGYGAVDELVFCR